MPRVIRGSSKIGERNGKRTRVKHFPITTKDNGSTDYTHNYAIRPGVLYAFSCCEVPIASNPFGPITRNGHSINLRGVRIKLCVRNDAAFRVVMNYALVSMKNSRGDIALIGTNEGLVAGATMTTDFFTSHLQNADEDFDQAALPSIQISSLAINTKKYNVHTRSRLILGEGTGAGESSGDRSNLKVINKYYAINRQIDFDDEDTNYQAQTPVFFIYWFTKFLGNKGEGNTPFGLAQGDCTGYFRDVHC